MSNSPGPAAEQVTEVLDRCVHPVLDRIVDERYGGFLVDLDERLRPHGTHQKSLEHAVRTTLALALLDRARPGRGYDTLFRHGCKFLIEAMWDTEYGGFYALVERDGTPAWDGLKHPHAVTYAARALLLAGQPVWACRALDWLDEVAWDPVNHNYRGTYRRDNTPYDSRDSVPTDHGADPLGLPVGFVDMNTTSDVIGAFVDLVPAGLADPARLGVLVDRVLAAVQPPGVLPYLFLPDWTPTPTLARTGQQFQTVRRLAEAGDLLHDGGRAEACALQLTDFGLTHARHPDGGFPMEIGPTGWLWSTAGSAPDERQWWVQLEAIDAASVAAQRSPRADHRERYAREREALWWSFVDRYVDRRHGGVNAVPRAGRRRRRHADGGSAKAHAWKDISHEAAILLDLAADAPAQEPRRVTE